MPPRRAPRLPQRRRREPQLVAADKISSGDTAWMLTSTALVLMMTIPGLALFYGGMVRKKNVLATLMQSFAITCSRHRAVGHRRLQHRVHAGATPFIGSFERLFLHGMAFMKESRQGRRSRTWRSTIPESVYMMFQMTFAIITPALICGAFADRMKFSAMLWFMGLWSVLIYSPIAHMVWEPSGYWATAGVLDFAGGTVVHINAGIAGLVCALVLGKRLGLRQGNDGAAQPDAHADRRVAAVGGLVRLQRRLRRRGRRPCGHGDVRHAVRHRRRRAGVDVHRVDRQGQAVGAGHRVGRGRGPGRDHAGVGLRRRTGAIVIGIAAGVLCFFAATTVKKAFGYDDSLDAFGVHCIGGIVGALLTGVFNVKEISGVRWQLS